MVAHAFNSSTQEAEAGGTLVFQASLIYRVSSTVRLHRKETLSKTKGKKYTCSGAEVMYTYIVQWWNQGSWRTCRLRHLLLVVREVFSIVYLTTKSTIYFFLFTCNFIPTGNPHPLFIFPSTLHLRYPLCYFLLLRIHISEMIKIFCVSGSLYITQQP